MAIKTGFEWSELSSMVLKVSTEGQNALKNYALVFFMLECWQCSFTSGVQYRTVKVNLNPLTTQ